MKRYLIVYERPSRKLLELREYDEAEHDRAMADRNAREAAEREHPEIEVVLLGATSREALQRTHSRYFANTVEH
jgi:hypothetical protein